MPPGRRKQSGVVQFGEMSGEWKASMDALGQEGRVDRLVAFLAANHELVEVRPVEHRRGETRNRVDCGRQLLGPSDILRGDPTEPVRPLHGQVGGRRDREQGLIRANVRHRFLPTDVLFPRLERQEDAPVAFRVPGQADHAARHLPDMFLPTREDPEERAAEIHLSPQGLALPDHDVGAKVSRRPHDGLRDRIHSHDEHGVHHRADVSELLLESAEEVRVLDVHAAHVRRQRGSELRKVEHAALPFVVDLADLEAGAEHVVREHRAAVVPHRPRDEEDATAVDPMGHAGSFAERRRAVVHRGVRGIHPGEFADQALVLPEGLQHALADLRLVRGVRAVELGPGDDRANARGHEVVVQAAPQERGHVDDRAVRREHRGDAGDHLVFREPVGDIEFRDPNRGRDVGEQVLDASHAHRGEHLVLVRGHAVCAERATALKGLAELSAEQVYMRRTSIRREGGRMLPVVLVSALLSICGVWWGLALIAWITWEKRFASPTKSADSLQDTEKKPTWKSKLVDVIEFGAPTVLAVGLAIDGFTGRTLLYAAGLSIPVPFSEGLQILGTVLLFAGLPLFTAGAYLTGRYVYSRQTTDRPPLLKGPYHFIRHPIYLG